MAAERATNLLLFGGFLSLGALASPPVNVALKASFDAAPYLVELLETAAEENSTAYFPLLDRIATGYFDKATSDEQLYKSFLQLLQDDGHITDAEILSSFNFALSVHAAAPRIEAHYQFYRTAVEPLLDEADNEDCETWIDLEGKQRCLPDLVGENKHRADVKSSQRAVLPFDRVLGDPRDPLTTILYADVLSPSFRKLHKTVTDPKKSVKPSYRVRYKPSKSHSGKPLAINGYGVELALKRTDYIVIDDRPAEDAKTEGSKPAEASLDNDDVADLKPLSSSELLELAAKAASFVMSSENQMETLLKLTQDFPKHSSAISAHNYSEEYQEYRENREFLLPPGYNVMWINGVQIDQRKVDAFGLLDHLRHERKLINNLQSLGYSGREAIEILSHKAIAEAQGDEEPQRYDFRDETEGGNTIIWLNNLEKDKRYEGWPSSVHSLLQRSYPGQLPPLRKDLHSVIIPVDLSNPKEVGMVTETVQDILKRRVPVRWGLVPTSNKPDGDAQAGIVYHLLDAYGIGAVMKYLEASLASKKLPSLQSSAFKSVVGSRKLKSEKTALSLNEVQEDPTLLVRVVAAKAYAKRLGLNGAEPPFIVNGVPIKRSDDWLSDMSRRVSLDLRVIQRGIFEDKLSDEAWLPSVFLEGAPLRRNALIVPEDEKSIKILDLVSIYAGKEGLLEELPTIAASQDISKEAWAQLVVIADLNTESGRQLVFEAIKFRIESPNIEVDFIHSGPITTAFPALLPTIVRSANIQSSDDLHLLLERLKQTVSSDQAHNEDYEAASRLWTSALALTASFGFELTQAGLVLNGRVIGPLLKDNAFTHEDFEALLGYESKKRIDPAAKAVQGLELSDRLQQPIDAAKLSSIVAVSTISDVPEGIFDAMPTSRMSLFDQLNSTQATITIGDAETSALQIFASIDPASETAQRWVPILKVLSELSGVYTRIFLNPQENLHELPVKRFYRYVLDSKPSFEADGSTRDLQAQFTGIPAEALLTMAMDVPTSWLVAPKDSLHDLDNIKLSLMGDTAVEAVYELENILIEGHSRDITSGNPPRGAQLILSTAKDPHYADTLVMANLGYFQFKANPGYYNINLQAGRSEEVFNIDSVGAKGYSAQSGDETTDVMMTSFQGATLFPRLSRKPGQEETDVLETPSTTADIVAKGASFADKLLNKAGVKGANTGKYLGQGLDFGSQMMNKMGLSADGRSGVHADINIFSVASGHLYERMLNIMMLSVMKHTKHTVKFWFIEQFLSPSFKTFLPDLAKEYGFEYEMVTYKWPHWLRAQKEKQREIWGYKILFLDVLFPLDLDKVIFVDADQIVRTDMYELVTHDLKGAPYGFTPMCDSRTEMEGFRFWKQGYWKNFLRGLPYHISALYVVDLKRFRQIAAGDRLRQQYHQLSADPNSLSNLDQDLPNNMQMALPIHSLPQEWLWCETWCSDESLKVAKTIDLCNNPETKEPKLDRARRQVPEWTVYDEEIAAVARQVKEKAEGTPPVVGEAPIASEEAPAKESHKRDEL